MQEARNTSNSQMLTQRMREYEDELERYVPVLMAQAQIFWDQGQYSHALAVLQQSREFVSENETWKLNVAHTFFMLVCRPFIVRQGPKLNAHRQFVYWL